MKDIINKYFVFGLILYFMIFVGGYEYYQHHVDVLLFNFSTFITFALVFWVAYRKIKFISTSKLFLIVFSYSFVYVFIINMLFYSDHGNFLQFQSVDETFYHQTAIDLSRLTHAEALRTIKNKFLYEDIGGIYYVYILYKILESTLFVNFINVLLASLSSVFMYETARYVMNEKYAFMASISFYLSSFWFRIESSGLKETIFVLFVILAFYYYITFLKRRKVASLILSIFFGAFILLFRPAVLGMLIVTFGISTLLNRQSNMIRNLLFAALLLVTFLYMAPSLNRMTNTFSSFETSIAYRRKHFNNLGGVQLGVATAAVASTMGPLPNILPRMGKENNSLYSSGLILKVLLSIPFWFAIWKIIRERLSHYYPYAIMSIMGLGALLYAMESFEFRYHLTYLPFFFIVSFGYLSYADANTLVKLKKRLRTGYLFGFLIMLYWSSRLI